ncbi:peroxiredoxin [Sulfitobacter sp. LCG007]
MLDVSRPAPDFTLPGTTGEVTLSALKGKPVVLFFYPKDDTPGCTTENVGFSDKRGEFEAAGAHVFGISKDTLKKHEKFAAKHDLKVPLLSDADGTVCEDYDVWKEKSMYGKTYMGIERTTVLIDAEGNVAQVWEKVKVPGHVEAVLTAVQGL